MILLQESGIEQEVEVTLALWWHALGWTLVGIALVKSFVYPFGQTTFLEWIKGKALIDALRGILITLVVVKLGAVVVDLAEFAGINMDKLRPIFDKIGADPVDLALVVAIVTQILIYRWRKKK